MAKKETVDEVSTPAPMGDTDMTPVTETPTEPETSVSNLLNNPDVLAYIDKRITEGIQDGIQKALRGTPPKANTVAPTVAEKENFLRMTYKERLNLFKISPETYKKLAKGGI